MIDRFKQIDHGCNLQIYDTIFLEMKEASLIALSKFTKLFSITLLVFRCGKTRVLACLIAYLFHPIQLLEAASNLFLPFLWKAFTLYSFEYYHNGNIKERLVSSI